VIACHAGKREIACIPWRAKQSKDDSYEASKRGEFDKVDSTLEQLIGQPPITMGDVLAQILQQS